VGCARRARARARRGAGQLLPAADERPGRGSGAVAEPDRFPRPHRLALALGDHLAGVAVLDRARGRAVGRFAHEDAVDGRGALQARRRVDDVAGDHPFALARERIERDHRLTGVDSQADSQVDDLHHLVQLGHRIAHRERRPDGALRIVLVCDGGPEDGHDRVPDELLDDSPEALDLGSDSREVRRQQAAHVLRVQPLGVCGRVDEIGEEDAHDLALLDGPGLRGDGGATRGAEARARR
jgi:hypothetical protein